MRKLILSVLLILPFLCFSQTQNSDIDKNLVQINICVVDHNILIKNDSDDSGVVTVCDILGQELKNENIESNSINQIVMLESQIYFVKVTLNNQTYTKKINIKI